MARYVVGNEGILALYRGLVPPLLSLSALNTINFTSYSFFRNDVFEASRGWDIRNGLAGMACGPLASSISTVENLIKVSFPPVDGMLMMFEKYVQYILIDSGTDANDHGHCWKV